MSRWEMRKALSGVKANEERNGLIGSDKQRWHQILRRFSREVLTIPRLLTPSLCLWGLQENKMITTQHHYRAR